MKLRIEPQGAVRESYSGARGAGEGGAVVLDLRMQRQELGRWCWAAIAVSLGDYYGLGRRPQHELATALLGFDCSRYRDEPEIESRCNEYAMLDEALRAAGCYSHWSPGRPTFERVRGEIASGRPVCVQVEWRGGGKHYVALTGCYPDTSELYVEDPLHGPSIQPFEKFPGRYRSLGGAWRGTYWTRPPGGEETNER